MYTYESCVILSPKLSDSRIDEIADELKAHLVDGGAEMKNFSRWGRRKLAYPIEKMDDGFYIIFFYTLETVGDLLVTLERKCSYSEEIFRVMTIKVPQKKKGTEIEPIVPSPGYLSEFSMKLRPQYPRRGGGDFRRRSYGDRPQSPSRPPASDAPRTEAAPKEAVATASAPPAETPPAEAPAAEASSTETSSE